MSLTTKKRLRTGCLNFLKNYFEEIDTQIANLEIVNEETLIDLKSKQNLLESKYKKYEELSEEIGELFEGDDEFIADREIVDVQEVLYSKKISLLKHFIEKHSKKPEASVKDRTDSVTSDSKRVPVKLPRFVIKGFSGEPTEYESFNQSFTEAIDKHPDLSAIEKMNYLISYLSDEALRCVKGLQLSHDNYETAKQMLEKRFGNKQLVISSHVKKLLDLEFIDSENVKGLRNLFDKIETEIRSLDSLGCDSTTYGTMLIPIIMEKLPQDIKLVLSRKFDDVWELNEIMKELERELSAREKVLSEENLRASNFTSQALFTGRGGIRNKNRNFGDFGNSSDQKGKNKPDLLCIFCRRNHYSKNCDIITKPEVRKSILSKESRCFICMKTGHSAGKCRKNWKCQKCHGRHNTAVCCFQPSQEQEKPPQENKDSETKQQTDKKETKLTTAVSYTKTSNPVLLQTARAQVSSTDERKSENLRLMFDTGSQQSYISKEARKRLNLRTVGKKSVNIMSFGNKTENLELDEVDFVVKNQKGTLNIYVRALVSDICLPLEDQVINLAQSKYKHLQDLKLADQNPDNLPLKIDILIGSQDYWNFIGQKQIRNPDGPTAISSELGYILSGPVEGGQTRNSTANVASTHFMRVVQTDRTEQKTSELEKVYDADWRKTLTEEDITVLQDFEEKTVFNEGRYHVSLPFKENSEPLGDNYQTAKKRLKHLHGKFSKDKQLFADYEQIINEQRNLNVIEECEKYSIGTSHYLSHRGVIRTDKQTTPLRIVFDASCKSRVGGPSLNDVLYTGPTITSPLLDVLIKLRAHNFVISGDLEKAFWQIALFEDDKNFVRFLWFKDTENLDFENFENNELIELRFTRVIFGLNSSPFLLQATLQKHIETHCENDFKETLKGALHVDDLNSGAKTIKEAETLYLTAKECLAKGGFNLRKFRSNSDDLERKIFERFPDDKRYNGEEKLLGIRWNKNSDKIIFNFAEMRSKFTQNATRRSLLSSIASIYDPLGLISPITVKMRILHQKVCDAKCKWDELIPPNLMKEWKSILNEFEEIDSIEIDRNYCFNNPTDPITNVQIHSFSDASENMIAATIYGRFTLASGKIKTSIILSRHRIISSQTKKSKKNSVPRGELNGLLLLSELSPIVENNLKRVYDVNEKTVYWVDSTSAYSWAQNKDVVFDDKYIQERVENIRKGIDVDCLKLVPSKFNPADIGTRGYSPATLINSELWFEGPDFLKLDEKYWPNLKYGDKFSDYKPEVVNCPRPPADLFTDLKPEAGTNSTCLSSPRHVPEKLLVTQIQEKEEKEDLVSTSTIGALIQAERFSSLSKLVRVTAWVLRYIKKLKTRIRNKKEKITNKNNKNNTKINGINGGINGITEINGITGEEMLEAKLLWVKDAQSSLPNEKNFKNLQRQLNLFVDDHGLFRCRGRIDNAELPYDSKCPILLPKRTKFTELVVLKSHKDIMHRGMKETLSQIRQEYWITQPRNFIKRILSKCPTCRYYEGQNYSYPEAGPLPKERVSYDNAFSHVGIDYAGPVYVTNIYDSDGSTHKAWIAIITCASSRAVYLDLATDCSGPACVNILRRYTNIFGCPKTVISDNGKNFISSDVQDFMTSKGVVWKFNIESSPWTGGFFERVVKMVKRCLRKVLRKSVLNFDDVVTLLKEIQRILNNRPLTYLYSDEVNEILTPNKLLYGRNIDTEVFLSESETESLEPSEQLTRIRGLVDYFWTIWKDEYLLELREHQRKTKSNGNLQPRVGDVVLIKDERVKRSEWRIGKIKRLIYSRDLRVRAAEVNIITNGKLQTLKRPVNKLYPVEFQEKTDQKDKSQIKFTSDEDTITFLVLGSVKTNSV